MESGDWPVDLTPTRDRTVLEKAAQPDPDRLVTRRSQSRRRRQQGDKIKACLCQSPAVTVVPRLLREMQQAIGVRLNTYSLEEPGWRLIWEVTFDYEMPWTCRCFVVRRLFAGQELDPAGCHCLGPAWEAPETWLERTDEELAQLLSQEAIEVRSAAGVRRVPVGEAGWEVQLQEVLREAYQHPLRQERGSC